MTRSQFLRRCRIAVAILPLVTTIVLNRCFDHLHDCMFWCYRQTDNAADFIADWIAGPEMQKPKDGRNRDVV